MASRESLLWIVCCWLLVDCARRPRQLVFPEGDSDLELATGFGIPVHGVPGQDVTMGLVIKYEYAVPQNGSELLQKRSTEDVTRWRLYSLLEDLLARFGLDGRACLLRAVCEAAALPLDQDNLAAEILHVLLTPSASEEAGGEHMAREYASAERLGVAGTATCGVLYRECDVSILDLISDDSG